MGVSAYVRSPAALALTALGTVAVGAVLLAGLALAMALEGSGATTDPVFLGGLGQLAVLVLAAVVLAVATLVWIPFGAGIAYAVGTRLRGHPAGFGASVSAVLDRAESLVRWTKTRVAVEPLAEYLLSEDDVAPTEVVVGCEKFVVPALVLDAPELASAVERANRVAPPGGRERRRFACLGTTAVVALGVYASGFLVGGQLATMATSLAVAAVIVGIVLTAALDTVWRTEVYLDAERSDGFLD